MTYPRQHKLFRHHEHGLVIVLDYMVPHSGKTFVRTVELMEGTPHGFVPAKRSDKDPRSLDFWVYTNDLRPADAELDMMELLEEAL